MFVAQFEDICDLQFVYGIYRKQYLVGEWEGHVILTNNARNATPSEPNA